MEWKDRMGGRGRRMAGRRLKGTELQSKGGEREGGTATRRKQVAYLLFIACT